MSLQIVLEYEPLPTQAAFHASPARHRCYAGGLGSGKTLAGAYEMLHLALEHPGSVSLVARSTYRTLRDTTQRTFLQVVPPEIIRDHSRQDDKLVLVNGSEILFRSLSDGDSKLRSLNLGAFWVDEASEVPESVYLTLLGRLRQETGPRRSILTTNAHGHDWIWKRFIVDPDPDYQIFIAPTSENKYLPPDYEASLRRQYPEFWVRRFLDVSFDELAGLVYPEWAERYHLVDPFDIPPSWPVVCGVDPGYRNPFAVVWAAIDDSGDLYLFAEHYKALQRLPEHAAAIGAINATYRVKPIKYVVDPAGRSHTGTSEQSYLDAMRELGLSAVPGNNDVTLGIERVAEHLRNARSGDHPGLFVMKGRCPNLVMEIAQYSWEDPRPRDEVRKEPEKPKKANDHLLDATRYLVMDRPAPRRLPSRHVELAYDALTGEPIYQF